MTKYVVGMLGALLGALGGTWLILAPFALAYQGQGADWADPTYVHFWTGLPLLIVSLVGLAAYAAALFGELRSRGVLESRPAAQQGPPVEAQAPGQQRGETEQLLMPLVAAMLKDMQDRERERGNGEAPRRATTDETARSVRR